MLTEKEQVKGVPLFMRNPSIVEDSRTEPIEGTDYTYDSESQTAMWMSSITLWTPTAYTDQRADGYKIDPGMPVPGGPN